MTSGELWHIYLNQDMVKPVSQYGTYEYNSCSVTGYNSSNCSLSERQTNATSGNDGGSAELYGSGIFQTGLSTGASTKSILQFMRYLIIETAW